MTKFALRALVVLFLSNIYIGGVKGWGNIMAVSMTYHFLGALCVAMLLASFYHSEFSKLAQPLRLIVVVTMVVAVGAFWEMSEYLGSIALTEPIYQKYHYHIYFMGDLADTVQDLVMDTIGALVFVSGSALNLRKRFNAQQA